jgi:DNA-binding IclR family transcriptional regulator
MSQPTSVRRGREADPTRVVGSDRVLAVLSELARHPAGVTLDELSRLLGSPKPTVHRALASLRRAGFAGQDGRGTYVLGDEFLRLAFTNLEARPEHVRVGPVLEQLADLFHETAHYAVLDGREVVYRAKVDPGVGAIKLTSVIGGRNPAHSTAVGKLLLAHQLPDEAAVAAWVRSAAPLERRTERTKTTTAQLAAELATIRERGYASDDQENEVGVNCLALPVYLTSARGPRGAVSVSALSYRTPLSRLVKELPRVRSIVAPLQSRAAS